MQEPTVRLVFRHITGARATEVDVVPLGAHRELILGRAPSAAVRFDPHRDPQVGRHHARIEPAPDGVGFRIADLGSRNGTFVNGALVTVPVALAAGDVVQLGESGPQLEVTFEVDAVPGARGRRTGAVSSSAPGAP